MANILIFLETNNQKVKPVAYEIMGKLQGQNIETLAIGSIDEDSKNNLMKFGASKIHLIQNDQLKDYNPEGYSNAVASFLKNHSFDYVFAGATAIGKDFFPRLSASFESGCASDITHLSFEGDQLHAVRPFFAGKCLAKVEMTGPKPHFITVRPNSIGAPEKENPQSAEINEINDAQAGDLRAIIKEVIQGASNKVDLTEANIIVSGGRAMKNSENFKILDELADVIGATVGASRAAVDSGYAPHAMQVGQTGKTVSPTLYIACGISGAIQHLAGMRTSKVIVAINSDPDAPIFSKADYGIVGDLFEIVPMLTEEFKKILNG